MKRKWIRLKPRLAICHSNLPRRVVNARIGDQDVAEIASCTANTRRNTGHDDQAWAKCKEHLSCEDRRGG